MGGGNKNDSQVENLNKLFSYEKNQLELNYDKRTKRYKI